MTKKHRALQRTDYVGIMLCMILSTGLFLLWTAHFWEIATVEVKGTTPNTHDYVSAFVQKEKLQGSHLLRINPLVLKKELEKSPLVKHVTFEREILPAALTLKVQERLPHYLLYHGLPTYDKKTQQYLTQPSQRTIIDAEGIVLPLSGKSFDYSGPLLYLNPSQFKGKVSLTHLNLIRELDALAEKEVLQYTGVFDVSDPQNLVFHGGDPALKVWLGMPEEILLKMQLIESTFKASEVPPSEIEYIDLRFWQHPVVKKRG